MRSPAAGAAGKAGKAGKAEEKKAGFFPGRRCRKAADKRVRAALQRHKRSAAVPSPYRVYPRGVPGCAIPGRAARGCTGLYGDVRGLLRKCGRRRDFPEKRRLNSEVCPDCAPRPLAAGGGTACCWNRFAASGRMMPRRERLKEPAAIVRRLAQTAPREGRKQRLSRIRRRGSFRAGIGQAPEERGREGPLPRGVDRPPADGGGRAGAFRAGRPSWQTPAGTVGSLLPDQTGKPCRGDDETLCLVPPDLTPDVPGANAPPSFPLRGGLCGGLSGRSWNGCGNRPLFGCPSGMGGTGSALRPAPRFGYPEKLSAGAGLPARWGDRAQAGKPGRTPAPLRAKEGRFLGNR